jgi:N-acetylmuramic acid 6-phosphate (MurNAc-6-P) etherase
MPPAPPMFSTMTCWPKSSLTRAAMMRATVSTGPPAAYGTTRVTGRTGQSCALALAAHVSAVASAAAAMVRIVVCMGSLRCC